MAAEDMMRNFKVFDADGHVFEDLHAIHGHLEGGAREIPEWSAFSIFPGLDGWPRGYFASKGAPGRPTSTDLDMWRAMLDTVGAEGAVLYPSIGFAVSLIQHAEWATAVATAYNNWIEATYTRKDRRLLAAGLLPVQDPAAAVKELRRCREQRAGFGVMVLPSVTKLPMGYGHKVFWPIYEEAERLDMPLALHGSPSWGFGLDHLDEFVKVHTLSHPLPLFIQLTDLVFSGVFDAFPRLRFAFLEAGCGWVPWFVDRLEHEYHSIFGIEARKRLRRSPRQVLCDGDQFWVGIGARERHLADCIGVMGSERLMYASDFPHEPPQGEILEEIEGLAASPHFTTPQKEQLLGKNLRRFLGPHAIGG
jgi:uncharacterized protein